MGSPLSYSGGRGRTDYRCKLKPGANGHPERDNTARASRKLPNLPPHYCATVPFLVLMFCFLYLFNGT